jgi:polyhydroxyalkanoate synthesis regulator phasin
MNFYAKVLARGDRLEYTTKLHIIRTLAGIIMDSIDLAKIMQRGYYVTLGASSSLLELLQDPIKREENLRMLGRSFDEVTQELAEKGVITEAEARSFVDNFIAQQINSSSTTTTTTTQATNLTTVTTTASPVDDSASDNLFDKSDKTVKASMRDEIEELTKQLASLRSELEQSRRN